MTQKNGESLSILVAAQSTGADQSIEESAQELGISTDAVQKLIGTKLVVIKNAYKEITSLRNQLAHMEQERDALRKALRAHNKTNNINSVFKFQ